MERLAYRVVQETAMRYAIPEKQVRRYSSFISVHMQDGAYNPELAFNTFLSCIAPETRALTLYSMRDNNAVPVGSVYAGLLDMLRGSGSVNEKHLPGKSSVKNHLENRTGSSAGGLLVTRGLAKVLGDGQSRRYMLSAVGSELALPLVEGAIKFVSTVGDTPGHRFDSMFRLLGMRKRQATVGRLIPCLIEEGPKSLLELQRVLQNIDRNVNRDYVRFAAYDLEAAGAVSMESMMNPRRNSETFGLRYRLSSIAPLRKSNEELAQAVSAHDKHRRGKRHYLDIISFIANNPDSVYTTQEMGRVVANNSGMSQWTAQKVASNVLRSFRLAGLLRTEGDLDGASRTKLKARELARVFYEMVLMPIKTAAFTLNPRALHVQPVTSEMIGRFYNNYLEERPRLSA